MNSLRATTPTQSQGQEAEIDAAIAAVLEADPFAHAVMSRSQFGDTLPTVKTNSEFPVDPEKTDTENLIDSTVSAHEAAIMRRRFPRLALG